MIYAGQPRWRHTQAHDELPNVDLRTQSLDVGGPQSSVTSMAFPRYAVLPNALRDQSAATRNRRGRSAYLHITANHGGPSPDEYFLNVLVRERGRTYPRRRQDKRSRPGHCTFANTQREDMGDASHATGVERVCSGRTPRGLLTVGLHVEKGLLVSVALTGCCLDQ